MCLSLNRRIWMLAWPLLLSNLTAPLLGLVDTAVVGHLDHPRYLAAVALGGNFFMFLYFSFNFLRMGTTGFASQARGGEKDTRVVLLRGLLLSTGLGLNTWDWPAACSGYAAPCVHRHGRNDCGSHTPSWH